MLKVIFVGYGEFGAGVLEGLIEAGCDVVGVVTWVFQGEEQPASLSSFLGLQQENPILKLIKKYHLKQLPFKRLNNYKFVETMQGLEIDFLVVACWGEILKPFVFTTPKKGTINCHPSLLPKHRGPNPFISVILQNESETGVTFHLMDEGIDTGPILLQAKVLIGEEDTGDDLRVKCSYLAKEQTPLLIKTIEQQGFQVYPQNNAESSYFPRPKPEDGAINWNNSASTIHNQMRGLYPWVSTYTAYRNKLFIFEKSSLVHTTLHNTAPGRILNVENGKILIGTASPDTCLLIEKAYIFKTFSLFSSWYIRTVLTVGENFYTP